MATKPVLTLEMARRVAAAAEAEALKNEWLIVIAIVDDGGHLIYLQREHDTQFGSLDIAIEKARAAAAFKRPTKASESAVLGGRLIHLALPGVIPADGGSPLELDGQVIGAIGISGARSFQDGQVATAAIKALQE